MSGRAGARVVVLTCVLLLVLTATGAGAALWVRSGTGASGDVPDPATAVRTALPGLGRATGEPVLPGLATADPAPGTVGRVAGPFDDRFELHRLALGRTAVTGELEVTSDVSDLLELQVVAGFYDRSGALVGQGRFTHHLDEGTATAHSGPPEERQAFSVSVPAGLRAQVVAAAVGVPVLVNE